jgi:hypothetical protein
VYSAHHFVFFGGFEETDCEKREEKERTIGCVSSARPLNSDSDTALFKTLADDPNKSLNEKQDFMMDQMVVHVLNWLIEVAVKLSVWISSYPRGKRGGVVGCAYQVNSESLL